jgi:hypothetical protein
MENQQFLFSVQSRVNSTSAVRRPKLSPALRPRMRPPAQKKLVRLDPRLVTLSVRLLFSTFLTPQSFSWCVGHLLCTKWRLRGNELQRFRTRPLQNPPSQALAMSPARRQQSLKWRMPRRQSRQWILQRNGRDPQKLTRTVKRLEPEMAYLALPRCPTTRSRKEARTARLAR